LSTAPTLPAQLGPALDLRAAIGPARRRFVALLRDLAPADWARSTVCPGWDVADIVAHVAGDDLGRLARGRDGVPARAPAPGEDLPTFLDRINGQWVAATRHLGPRLLTDMVEWSGAQVAAHWAAIDLTGPADVSWAGVEGPVAWMDLARDHTEYWIHEQQVREATGRARSDPAETATVVGVLARGLPVALRAVPGADGDVVVVTADDLGASWAVEHRGGRWWVTDPPPGIPGTAGGGPGTGGGSGTAAGGPTTPVRGRGTAGGPPVVASVRAPGALLWRRWSRHPLGDRATIVAGGTGDPAAVTAVADHLAVIRPADA
jgi:uncharacterized protein (TIGR03083 family)